MLLFSGKFDDLIVTQIAAHQAEIHAYIQSLLPGNSSVNDILQLTNLVIWRKRATFKPGTNFNAWAFSIARWEVRTFLKNTKRKSWLIINEDLANQISETMTESAEEVSSDEQREALDLCMQKLTAADRELVTHRYHTDAPLKDFAESSGRSVGSLKVTLCRIRATLKRCIESRQSIQNATEI